MQYAFGKLGHLSGAHTDRIRSELAVSSAMRVDRRVNAVVVQTRLVRAIPAKVQQTAPALPLHPHPGLQKPRRIIWEEERL
jgi:hypothetical protein